MELTDIKGTALGNKYFQGIVIIAVLYLLYKLVNSDLFKGVGSAVEGAGSGVGSAVSGLGSGIGSAGSATGEAVGTVVTATALVYKNYAELVASVPTKLGTWTGLVDDPKDKPWLDLYENLPWSLVSYSSRPFFIPASIQKTGILVQNYEWIKNNIVIPIKDSGAWGSYDEDKIFGAVDKCRSWVDFMRLAERFKPATNLSLRAFLDKALTTSEKVELAKIMNKKPLYNIA